MVELDRLRDLSARVGADPLLVQAAGGNTSLKDDAVMWIKASGTWLRDAATRDIFVAVDHGAIMRGLAAGDRGCESCTAFIRQDISGTGLRPSIETTVHALLPQRVVVHVHCVNTLAWAIRADAERRLAERLAGFAWAFVPYARPGLPLAGAIAAYLRPGIDVLVLGNHGLVVGGDTVEQAEALLTRVVAALARPLRAARPVDEAELGRLCAGRPYRPAAMAETHALATDPLALNRAGSSVFYPDHVVFLGVGVATSFDGDPPLVAIPGLGVVLREDAKAAVEPMGRCLADVMRRIGEEDPLVAISAGEISRLVNWDAEKYRQTLKMP